MKAKLLIISGPSAGVGKDTIVKMFLAKHPDWHYLVSATTRPSRTGEIEGRDYYFLKRAKFEDLIKTNQLLEWFEVTGHLYGTLRQPVEEDLNAGQNVILRKEVNGALAIKKAKPEAVTVILLPNSLEELRQRIVDRHTDSPKVIEQRLELAKKELTLQDRFDFKVVNPHGHPKKAVAEIEKILKL